METVYDWVTLAIFAGLVVLFLQRSTGDQPEKDASLLYYLGAGVACAAARSGSMASAWCAAAHQGFSANLFTITSDMFPRNAVGIILFVLKPFKLRSGS